MSLRHYHRTTDTMLKMFMTSLLLHIAFPCIIFHCPSILTFIHLYFVSNEYIMGQKLWAFRAAGVRHQYLHIPVVCILMLVQHDVYLRQFADCIKQSSATSSKFHISTHVHIAPIQSQYVSTERSSCSTHGWAQGSCLAQ